MKSSNRVSLLVLLAAATIARAAYAAEACPNRGELDAMYCDANKDMVADVPADPRKWKSPSTIVFTYTPVEDPAVYENIFKPFTTHLAACLDKKVVFYQVQNNAAEIEAMRDAQVPLRKKMGTGWDVANAALFLASDEVNFITGVTLPVDGGASVRRG